MKLNVQYLCISGVNKQDVINEAKRFVKDDGYIFLNNIYRSFNILMPLKIVRGRIRVRWIYRIDLFKPIDFEIIKK